MPAPGRTAAPDVRLLALGLLAGILVIYALPRLPPWPLLLVPLPLLVPRWPGRAALAAALLGAALALHQADARLEARLPPADQAQDLWLTGTIASLPERKDQDWRFLFAPADGRLTRIRASWYRSEAALRAGDCWRLQLRLKPPRGLLSPGGFDYEAWLFREGIGATGYVRAAAPCAAGDRHGLSLPSLQLLRLRQALVERVNTQLNGHPMRGFVLGLTVGDASGIDDAQWRVLRRTGTTHLLSISGLHISLAAGFVFFLMRWLWALWPALCLRLPAQRAGALAACVAALGYAVLAGFSIPTQRALVMLLVVMGAVLLSRQVAPSRLLALALVAVLLLDTAAVLYPGFWLSFGAVAWLLYVLAGRVGPVPRWQAWLTPQAALALALVPPCLYWFGEFSLVSPLANAIMIPLFSLLIPWLLAAVLALGSALGEGMLGAGATALDWLWRLLLWLAEWPGAYQTWRPPALSVMLLALAGLLLALAPRGFPARALGLALCLPLFVIRPPLPPPGHFDFALLDVGQGLAAVVRTQRHTLLYDAGPAFPGGLDSGAAVVLPFLRQQGIRRLDRLVLSHGDLDHRGGVAAVRDGVGIGEEIGTERGRACRAGERWEWDGVLFEFLHPDGGTWADNDGSCVLRVRAGAHALLLTGDIQREAEQHLLRRLALQDLRATVLVVPHHGSRSSSTPGFVAVVAPQLALVAAGWANRWGFPKPEVVARYRAAGAQVESTGAGGTLQFRMHPERGIERFTRWREQSRRVWRAG
jgi:competence protein ComEC